MNQLVNVAIGGTVVVVSLLLIASDILSDTVGLEALTTSGFALAALTASIACLFFSNASLIQSTVLYISLYKKIEDNISVCLNDIS